MKRYYTIILLLVVTAFSACQSEIQSTPTTISERPAATPTIILSPTQIPQVQAADPVITSRPTETRIDETAVPPTPTVKPSAIPPTATYPPFPTPINTPVPSPTALAILPTDNEGVGPPTWVGIGTPLPLAGGSIAPDNVSGLVEVGRWGKGAVLEAAYSPDGSRLYVLTQQGVYVYDSESSLQLAFYSHTELPYSMALSPDGRIMALSTGKDPYYFVELRDAANFKLLGAFFPHEQPQRGIYKLLFDSSGQYLFVGTDGRIVNGNTLNPALTAWDLNSLEKVAQIDAKLGFDYAPESDLVVTNNEDGYLYLWKWKNQTFIEQNSLTIPENFYNGTRLAISPNGQYIALSGVAGDSKVGVWEANNPEPIYIMDSSRQRATASLLTEKTIFARPNLVSGPGRDFPSQLLFSPDSKQLATATGYFDVTLWQASDGSKIREWIEVGSSILYHPTEPVITAGRYQISQWNLNTGAFVNTFNQHFGGISDLAIIPGKNQLAIASHDSFIYLRQLQTGDLFTSLKAGISNETWLSSPIVRSIDVTADGQTLVSASNDAYRVWDLNDYSMTTLSPTPRDDIGSDFITISPDGKHIIGKEHDYEVRYWTKGQIEASLLPIFSPWIGAFSPAASIFVTTDAYDVDFFLWDAETVNTVNILSPEPASEIRNLSFSANGRYLAGPTAHDSILVWAINGLETELVYNLYAGSMLSFRTFAAFSPDNQILAHSAWEQLRFWDMSDGSLLHSIDMEIDITAITFSPDGNYLITGHQDGSVRFWAVP